MTIKPDRGLSQLYKCSHFLKSTTNFNKRENPNQRKTYCSNPGGNRSNMSTKLVFSELMRGLWDALSEKLGMHRNVPKFLMNALIQGG